MSIPSLQSALKDLLHIFSPKHYFDTQSLSDLKPGLIDLKEIIASYFERLFDQFREKKLQRATLKKSQREKIERHLKHSKKILFVCYGNINRSAIAHIMANHIMSNHKNFEFKSTGFHFQGGRTIDHHMSAIAKANKLQVEDFRSTVLSADLVEWSDIIFVMECKHIHQLTERYAEVQGKAFLLGGLFQNNSAIEIGDPYNQSKPVYEDTYQKVNRCVSNMKQLLLSDNT